MHPLKVTIVSLGSLKYPVNMSYLEGWKSQIIKLSHGASVGHLHNAEGDNWEYTSDQLYHLLHADNNASFTVALISAPLEENYYMRRLGDKVAVISLFEMAEIVRYTDFTIENYILRNIYEIAVLYAANGALIPSDAYSWAHDDVRGCLFDMNANKSDIVFSLHQPKLCDACKAKVLLRQVDSDFLPALSKELQKIKKALYFRMSEWVKAHPIMALTVAALSAIFLNLIASVIFEKAKYFLPWLG
jgi:hypothetical protein